MVKIEAKDIDELFKISARLEREEPLTEEQLSRDIELSEEGNYKVLSEVKSRGALNFIFPDFSQPFAIAKAEAGVAIVEGFGSARIDFKKSFSKTPGLVESKFGFFELRVPWVAIEWRSFNIAWWTIRIPVPKITTMTVRLPTMCFLMNVDKNGFEVFNVVGRTHIVYLAIGR